MKRIIVTRFSAMGDVAMVASVLKALQQQHNETEIIMVSRKAFAAFFEEIPRLTLHHIEPKGKHKGVFGLWKLFRELAVYKATYFADLHQNLRSNFLTTLFKFTSIKKEKLHKGRAEKLALIQHGEEPITPLKAMTERYAAVFRALGFSLSLTNKLLKEARPVPKQIEEKLRAQPKAIGIAPFAQHLYKVFPLQKMEKVIQYLTANNYSVFIFGGGKAEQAVAEQWSTENENVFNTIGQMGLKEELDLIANLQLLISMDSAGMHMASLVGTRCLSIWGATHPYLGFLGYGQDISDCIQVPHPNRPSSVYGNKPCICDGVEAIDLVTPEMVITKIKEVCG